MNAHYKHESQQTPAGATKMFENRQRITIEAIRDKPDIIREIGEAMYGNRWQRPLARALDDWMKRNGVTGLAEDTTGRRLRRWTNAEFPIDPRAAEALVHVYKDFLSLAPIERTLGRVYRALLPRVEMTYAQIVLHVHLAAPRPVTQSELTTMFSADRTIASVDAMIEKLIDHGFLKATIAGSDEERLIVPGES